MAVTTNSTTMPNRTPVSFRGAAPKFARKALKRPICISGLYEIYLNDSGQIMVRRLKGTKYYPAFYTTSVEHAVEMAKTGELAKLEATQPD